MKKKIGAHSTVSEIQNGVVTQEKGKVKLFDGEPAVVRVSMGTTLNMGNYQSLRLGVDLALPCAPAKVEAAFVKASAFVQKKLDKMIQENTPKSLEVEHIDEVEL